MRACHSLLLVMLAFAVREATFAAEPPCAPAIAELVSAQGSIEIRRLGEAKWQPARLSDMLCAGDRVRVKERSRAELALTNEIYMRLDEQTTVTLLGVEAAQPSLLELCRGAMHFFTRYRKTFRVITPFVNAAVEGTELSIDHTDVQDNISVYEGQVTATNEPTRLLPETCEDLPRPAPIGGSLILTSGESAVIPVNQAPSKLPGLVARPEDAVQWALYYPPIVDYGFEDVSAPGTAVRESVELYRQGKLTEAISRIDKLPEGARDPRFLTYRAGLLLLVGRVDQARPDIEQALKLDPGNSDAYALKAIISVVQNQKGEALALATKAVELDQKSSTARIALSYAQQANFQIEQALESVKQAGALDPKNALAWARLAELEMSTGNLDRALAAAERAVSLNPNLARTQTVLGFAHLTRIDTQAAKTSFTRAIELDQADPMPRLGLGLAKIRESNLEDGRREIEIATSLDPASSLTRSYLGKAYYEEKRDELAGTQYDLAKALDPRDPTPWFYDAIRKQTINRPVEALEDLEESIELNDNRAVYRSRLLLDQDLSVRNVSLARLYSDVGFDQRGLDEASKSLASDPGNHSAHRFLSDTYVRVPRHEIARVSELLRAKLLQPVNASPVQPCLAETDALITKTSAPELGYAEYTRLLDMDRVQFYLTGLAGNQGRSAGEGLVAGQFGRFSYSAGGCKYSDDGFRENQDYDRSAYNLFAQYAFAPQGSVQIEFQRQDKTFGDLGVDFDPANFSPFQRHDVDQRSTRAGLHLQPHPASHFIASVIRAERSEQVAEGPPGVVEINVDVEDKSWQTELQYIREWEEVINIVSGVGLARTDTRDVSSFTDFLESISFTAVEHVRREQANVYTYVNGRAFTDLDWTLGASFESLRDIPIDANRTNPKLGVRWYFDDNATLRFAAFKTTKRILVQDQTIEPTQIAGFNQFFDDVNGTRTERLGLGLDVKFSRRLFAGIEGSRRKLEWPIGLVGPTGTEFRFENRREKLLRGYLYWAVNRVSTVSFEPSYENFERDPIDPRDPLVTEIRTILVPLTFRFNFANGIFANVGPRWIKQSVDRPDAFEQTIRTGRDDFTVLDAAIGYRFPKRRGIISLEGRNLTDQNFLYRDDNFRRSEVVPASLRPERSLWVRVSLYF